MFEFFKTASRLALECWWIIVPVALFFIFRTLWLTYIQNKFAESIEWSLLEVKIPREVQKTPKAMEQIFASLHGIHGGSSFSERWLKGKIQQWFSLEIISTGGQIHFLIRTPKTFRNLIEAQFYAQYPDAEISEVDDYATSFPLNISRNKDYEAWGTELVLTKEDAYPIRTYPYFFEQSKEEERVDPLASLSEVLSHLTHEEHIWIQILVRPTGDKWKKEGEKIVAKLIGKEEAKKRGLILEETHGWFEAIIDGFRDLFFGAGGDLTKKEEQKKSEVSMSKLTPGQKEVVTAIENNIAKLGLETAIRIVYWAKSDIFSAANKAAIAGSFKQFNTQNLNGFKTNKKVKEKNIFDEYKKRYFPHRNFSSRGFVFNTEELATIYHIPGRLVTAQDMPRIEAKKGGPPRGLPTST